MQWFAHLSAALVADAFCVSVCLCYVPLQVTFTGQLSQVVAAFRLVYDSASATDPSSFTGAFFGRAPTAESVTLRLLVGNLQAGAVIGKGGDGIKSIRAHSNTNLKVFPIKDMPPGVRGDFELAWGRTSVGPGK